jgi:hypothetical protein
MLSVDFDVRDAGVFPLTRQENCAIIAPIGGDFPMMMDFDDSPRALPHLAQTEADVKAEHSQSLKADFDKILRELETCSENATGLTDDEKIDMVAARILKEYKAAFEELGK